MRTLSLSARDARRRERKRAALLDVERRLRAHAHSCGGRYILFGSAARGDWSAASDLDVLVDFPSAFRRSALAFAETACAEHGLRCDARPIDAASDRLAERAVGEGRVLA